MVTRFKENFKEISYLILDKNKLIRYLDFFKAIQKLKTYKISGGRK